jgi:hypothetical protein
MDSAETIGVSWLRRIAFAAGCLVVIKLATTTPLSCLAFVALLKEAGMPLRDSLRVRVCCSIMLVLPPMSIFDKNVLVIVHLTIPIALNDQTNSLQSEFFPRNEPLITSNFHPLQRSEIVPAINDRANLHGN